MFKTVLVAVALAVALPLTSPPAAQAADTTTEKPKKAKKAKTKGDKKTATFYEGSGETKKERTDRLKRECKGKPNAGACEGYTR